MENNIEEALWKDYHDLDDILKVISETDDRKNGLLEERDKIRNELIKLEQSRNEMKIKKEEIAAEDKRERNRNRVSYTQTIATICMGLYGMGLTFMFDQEHTITSTLGRNILNAFIPKFGKK